jgi:hypothetical protein
MFMSGMGTIMPWRSLKGGARGQRRHGARGPGALQYAGGDQEV